MCTLKSLVLTVVLFFSSLCLSAQGALPVKIDEQELPSLAPMLDKVQDAVVNISTSSTIEVRNHPLLQHPLFRQYLAQPDQLNQTRQRNSLGSGVIIDEDDGYVVTNYHVIKNADQISVTLIDGREFSASVVGHDEQSDLAVIQIKADNLKQMSFADVNKLRVGDFVVAIGNAFGLSHTVSSGIISGLGRSGLGMGSYADFIQTDASVNLGNSGGALVNLRGELIGINTAILSQTGGSIGIGFAIPVDMVQNIKNQLIKYGEVRRSLLGIQTQNMDADLAAALGVDNNQGVVVIDVYEKSNAQRSGLRIGDIIFKVDNKHVRTRAQLVNAIALIQLGEKASLSLYRNGKIVEKSVTIENIGPLQHFYGIKLRELNDEMLIVEDIAKNSPADGTPLRINDIIYGVNKQRVYNLNDFYRVIEAANEKLTVFLLRNGNRYSVELKK